MAIKKKRGRGWWKNKTKVLINKKLTLKEHGGANVRAKRRGD